MVQDDRAESADEKKGKRTRKQHQAKKKRMNTEATKQRGAMCKENQAGSLLKSGKGKHTTASLLCQQRALRVFVCSTD